MAPFQTFFLVLSLAVFALAWLRGGHTERAGVVVYVLGYAASYALHGVHVGDFALGDAIIDLAVLAGLLWLSLRRERWWTLGAAAFAVLTMAVHAAMLLVPELDARADIAARWGLGVMMVLCLGGGVLERWLAGEPPASPDARWRRGGAPLP